MDKEDYSIDQQLFQLVEKKTMLEDDLLQKSKEAGIDLGSNPRTRLKYMVKLGIIAPAELQYLGRGKGTVSFFHPDTFDILKFLDSLRPEIRFNEAKSIIDDEINSRIVRISKELNYENPIPGLHWLHFDLGGRQNSILKKRYFSELTINRYFFYVMLCLIEDGQGHLAFKIDDYTEFFEKASVRIKNKDDLKILSEILEQKQAEFKMMDDYLTELYTEAKKLL